VWSEGLRIARFALSGSISTLLYTVIFLLLVSLFNWSGVSASALAYCIALPFSFMMQKRFAFRSTAATAKELPAFVLLQLVCGVIAVAVAHYARDVWHFHPLVSVGAVGLALALVNYVAMRTAIFKVDS
jgi:putative flippase GtrA